MQQWQPDVLGTGFQCITLPLGADEEGEVVATLVRHLPGGGADARPGAGARRAADTRPARTGGFRGSLARATARWAGLEVGENRAAPLAGTDVLYLHGWSDYFFQAPLAEFWSRLGARFYALDLRKYGRSLRPGQTPGFITNLADYDEDIAAALAAMGRPDADAGGAGGGRRRLILMGHSTGGLTLSLWLARHPGAADALVLNSPWLEVQTGTLSRAVLAPLVDLHARLDPRGALVGVDRGYYTRTVWAGEDGEWRYNLDWRPQRGFGLHIGWLRAILAGHAQVAAGLGIDAPVLVMLSAHSAIQPTWSDQMRRADVVLSVDDIAARATRLGRLVTVARFDGALHDLVLSPEPVRAAVYRELEGWLRALSAGRMADAPEPAALPGPADAAGPEALLGPADAPGSAVAPGPSAGRDAPGVPATPEGDASGS